MILPTGNNLGYRLKKGFTLLELLLVIVIISILLGVSTPLIKRNIESTSFKSFINKSYFLLDYAKTLCIFKNTILEVNFDLNGNRIILIEKGEKGEEFKTIKIPKGLHFEIEKETILFYPDGTMEEFEIIISDNEQRKAVISSKGFDGKIRTDQRPLKKSLSKQFF